MWLLTTRNRPALCQAVLDACIATGCSTPGLVWMDGCDYGRLRLPPGWRAIAQAEHLNIGEIMRTFYAEDSTRAWYGWMSDDCFPRTPGWDRRLVAAAGRKYVSYGDDLWLHGRAEDGKPHVTSVFAVGGDLVRAMGFFALPGLVQMYIDAVIESVAVPCGLMRYLPDVVCEHLHCNNGRRPRDSTDTRVFKGRKFPADDAALYRAFLASAAYDAIRKRVAELPC